MLWLVRHLTKPGKIILDCFCGTGTTLVAAQQLNRRWIGCDRSKTYCQIAMSRLADICASRQEFRGEESYEPHQPPYPH